VVGRIAGLRQRVAAWSALPVLVVDTLIAVLCYLATVALPVKGAASAGWSLLGLAALASLPLLWRRRQPVVVAVVVGVGTVGLAVTGAQNQIPLPYGQLVATYTLASLAPPLWRVLGMICTAIGVVVSVVVVLGQGPATLATVGLPFVVAYAMGTGVRARRDRIAMLEERARRLAEEHEMTTALERERIAREIHDIVAHAVTIVVVQAEAGLVVHGDPDKARTIFDTISATGRDAMAHLDRALGVLRGNGSLRTPEPGIGDLPQLVATTRLAGLDASLTVSGEPRTVPADLAAATYRLAQEALTNTVKHARARHVWVRLDWRDAALRLEVVDDGDGPVAPTVHSGHGLVGMRERVRAFGGRLQTGRGDGGTGFRVVADLPLHSGQSSG
jgi:signal transduction histidine kinase